MNSYHIVTGGAGFIGSNIVKALSEKGEKVIVVDSLENNSEKFKNLIDLDIEDLIHPDHFIHFLENVLEKGEVKSIIHQGAISSTQETDARLIMKMNYEYSLGLLQFCLGTSTPFYYASTAGVYGLNQNTEESPENEKPITLYGYSKLLFDQRVRKTLETLKEKLPSQIVGLRYFNVYGPREQHKIGQYSPFYRYYNNLFNERKALEFMVGPTGTGVNAEDFARDFVYVDDVVKVVSHFMDNPEISGIFNVGTGYSNTFKEIKNMILKDYKTKHKNKNLGIYNSENTPQINKVLTKEIQFPKNMIGKSQPLTRANLIKLKNEGKYTDEFLTIEEGWDRYYEWLQQDK